MALKWPPFQKKAPAQMEFPLGRALEPDRNHHQGGRSFYFFDFDDNVAFLTTPMFLFHRRTGEEIEISSREFADQSPFIGRSGIYADYGLDYDPRQGSFRCFRDRKISWLEKRLGRRQAFVEDLAKALTKAEAQWKGPSWDYFYHAVFNGRPLAVITARGHHPQTIEHGIQLWVDEGHLPSSPNYLGIYPVSHPETQRLLQTPNGTAIPELKQRALRAAVEKAFAVYGYSPHHRFGMSDDDPSNIEWMVREMKALKKEHKDISFFIIQTHGGQTIKHEVFEDHVVDQCVQPDLQLSLGFDL